MTEEMGLRQWAVESAIEMGGKTLPDVVTTANALIDYVMGLSEHNHDVP